MKHQINKPKYYLLSLRSFVVGLLLGMCGMAAHAQCLGGMEVKTLKVDWGYGIYFTSENVGCVAANGSIRRTIDGGETWTISKLDKGLTGNFRQLYFANQSTGWVCVANGQIGKTTDGGDSWKLQNSNTSIFLRYIHGTSDKDVWAVGYEGTVVHTTDGGDTWQNIQIPEVVNVYPKNMLSCVFMVPNSTLGFIGGEKGQLLKTSNSGQTWKKVLPPNDTTSAIVTIHFLNDKLGMAVGDSGMILKTTDGGESWNKIPFQSKGRIRGVQILSPDTVFIAGKAGIFQSIDGGLTWAKRFDNKDDNFWDLRFPSKQVGYVAGGRNQFVKMTTTNAPPVADFIITSDSVLIASASPGFQYQWFRDGDSIPGANAGIYTADANGAYKVRITLHDCSTLSEAKLVTGVRQTTSTHQPMTETKALHVYPNPAHGSFQVLLNAEHGQPNTISIINKMGQVVYSRQSINNGSAQTISTDGFSKGVYLIRLQTNKYVATQQIAVW